MADGKSTRRYETNEIQGENSWIEVRLALIGEVNQFIKEGNRLKRRAATLVDGTEEGDALEQEARQLGSDWYSRNVIAWTWTDEDGKPLPLPSADPDVLDRLTQPQLEFLAAAINGSAVDQKKRPKR